MDARSSAGKGGYPQLGQFYGYILLFMVAMLGIVFADNLLLLFLFWELTSISSYLLIGFNHTDAKARKSALQALLVTGSGGLALLAGLVLLGQIAGAFSFSGLLQQRDLIQSHALYTPMALLILLGAATKSAQFPFHFWLPHAMAAPPPVCWSCGHSGAPPFLLMIKYMKRPGVCGWGRCCWPRWGY